VPSLVWPGAIGLGVFGMSGYAVSMVAVMAAAPPQSDGRAAAWVSAGFFSGFALGPPAAGLLAQHVGYAWMWGAVAMALLVAGVVSALLTVAVPPPSAP